MALQKLGRVGTPRNPHIWEVETGVQATLNCTVSEAILGCRDPVSGKEKEEEEEEEGQEQDEEKRKKEKKKGTVCFL